MISTSVIKTSSGYPVLRSVYEGDVSVDEARRFIENVKPTGPYHHYGHLVLGKMLDVSSESRKILGAEKPPDPTNPPPVALVIPSAMMRMAVSLVTRASGNTNTEFFKDETEALAWLDGAMATYEKKRR